MADSFIALYCFHGMFVHGVVKLSFSNKFFSDRWLLQESERFHVLLSRLPLLNDCLVTKQTFCIVILRDFRSNSVVFFQLWALAMKITVVSHRK